MKLLAALTLLTALPAFAAPIDGVVMNGTTGKPQPNATVTVYRVSGNGPESLESVKSDADGRFTLKTDIAGPRLVQAAFDGVTYNKMIPPGAPSSGLVIPVYKSEPKPGSARVDQHMILLEPGTNGRVAVSEGYIWENPGKTTFNDPDHGTLNIYLPPAAQNQVVVNVLGPGGAPIRRAPEKTDKPDVYKIDFPIKPGQSQVQISYSMPFTNPGEFQSRVLYQGGGPTRVIVPEGVSLAGSGLQDMGGGPMKAHIYSTDSPNIKVQFTGTGALRAADNSGSDQGGGGSDQGSSPIAQIMPKLYGSGDPNAGFPGMLNSVKWLLLTTLAILALGLALLYRASPVETAKAKSERTRR